MNNELSFELSTLLPSFSSLFNQGLGQPDGLSAAVVAILWLCFFVGLGYVTKIYINSRNNIDRLQTILSEVKPEEIAEKRRDIKNRINSTSSVSELWDEFDESLVTSHDGKYLFNVFNAAFFFNPDSLAGKLVENRLLAAMPAILTAIGVIGTFAGLQLGLKGVDLSAESDAMRQQINILIGGAAVAFMTSVWGVLCSLVFNILEKLLEQSIRSRISQLQARIDCLFKRTNAEQTLISIEDHSKESRETLQGLAERIGSKMQEAVMQVSDNMQSSLETVLGPAINTMVEAASDLSKRQAQGAEQALDGLIGSFLETFSREGATQREMMESASRDVQDAVANLGTSMVSFMARLEEQQERVNADNRERNSFLEQQIRSLGTQHQTQNESLSNQLNEAISELLSNLGEHQRQSSESEHQRLEELLSGVRESVRQNQEVLNQYLERSNEATGNFFNRTSEELEAIGNRDQRRDEVFTQRVQSLEENQLSMLGQIEELYQTHIEVTNAVLNQGKELANSVSEKHELLQVTSSQLRDSAGLLRQAATDFETLGTNVRRSAESLSSQLSEVTGAVDKLTSENAIVTTRVNEVLEKIRDVGEVMEQTSTHLTGSAEKALDGFERLKEHHNEFSQKLTDHVRDLDSEMEKLLLDYHQQVSDATSERMIEWNRQTSDFSQQMTGTVQIMAQIIDDIDNNRSNSR